VNEGVLTSYPLYEYMTKAIDDALEPIRENMEDVEALAESDNPAASMARVFLEHLGESEPVRSEPEVSPTPSSSPSNDGTEQLAGVFDF
jgi:hypothetical protein